MDKLQTLCVMGILDGEANDKVFRLKTRLSELGIAVDDYEPHITFGIYTGLDQDKLKQWIKRISEKHKRISLQINHFGFFPDTRLCFLAPGANRGLLNLYEDIHKQYDDCCSDKGCLYSLKQSNWVPHMTIAAIEPHQTAKILSNLWAHFSPFSAEMVRLKISSSDDPVDAGTFDLKIG